MTLMCFPSVSVTDWLKLHGAVGFRLNFVPQQWIMPHVDRPIIMMRQTHLRVRLQRFDGVLGAYVRLEQMQVRPGGPCAIE